MNNKNPLVRLGDYLLEHGHITSAQLNDALAEQKRTGRALGKVLVDNGSVSEEQVARCVAEQLELPFIDLLHFDLLPQTVRLLPELQSRRFRALVLKVQEDYCMVGLTDPTDLRAQDELSLLLRRPLTIAVITNSQFNEVIDRSYPRQQRIDEVAQKLEREVNQDDEALQISQIKAGKSDIDAPVIKLLQTLFEEADRLRASDIHIEPQERKLLVRYRIDGVLYTQLDTDPRAHPALLVRLKLLAGLDIAERRLPQDGRFMIRTTNNRIDVRLSTLPTLFGESAVMRLLMQSHVVSDLEKTGMMTDTLQQFKSAISAPYGMVLVTGPTGSGKSTTLYCALQKLNQPDVKILTCEDPIEYRITGINQVQINEKIELSYSRVLRAFLRQDPDILLVGEIRDQETAEISARAAMTGHLVLSTLHTNDAISAPARLLDLGLPGYMIASTLLCVVSQRLLRLVCPSCAELHQPRHNELDWLRRQFGAEFDPGQLRQGRGCSRCNGLGYKGRTAVHELLEITPPLASALHFGKSELFEQEARLQLGRHTIGHRAVDLVLKGQTTIQEAMKIVTPAGN